MSFLDDGSESDSGSDIEMVRSAVRRPHASTSAAKKPNTMQDRILEEVQKQLAKGDQKSNEELMEKCRHACDMRDELRKKINDLGKRLPSNTLDQLIEELGGANQVAVSE